MGTCRDTRGLCRAMLGLGLRFWSSRVVQGIFLQGDAGVDFRLQG